MSLLDRVLGRPLADEEEEENRVGVGAALPMLGLDALTSCAYGSETAMIILLPLGMAGLHYLLPISAIILALLAILYMSYRQTIFAYPNGGGSYTVAKENLGTRAGLLAAASLLVDYILTVAVGISAGIGALVSAFPSLQPHIVLLCLASLVMITFINLRGIKESGVAFALPAYVFLGSMLGIVAFGTYKVILTHGHPLAVSSPPPWPAASATVTWWLLIRAFASGCAAMTGIEAVSNGVTAFREPRVLNAQKVLTLIIGLLALLLAGIAWLVYLYQIGPMDPDDTHYQSVVSMLVAAVVGRGTIYYITIGSILAVLTISANTSFAGFPRLCHLLAQDDYLPHSLAVRGRRLVFSVGIVGLAALAGMLLVIFGGITDRLIPLYSVGAFGAFTLSQAGMVVHWLRNPGPGSRLSLVLNATGAVSTGLALVVVLSAKFLSGAWITLLIIPLTILLFEKTRQHYQLVNKEISTQRDINLDHLERPVVVIPIKGWSSITEKALRFAYLITDTILCVYIRTGDQDESAFLSDWREYVEGPVRRRQLRPPSLEMISSPYRLFFKPMQQFIREVLDMYPERTIAVIIPELAETRWYEYLLHNQRATWLKASLLLWGENRVAVINVPWFLHKIPEHEQIAAAKLEALMSES